MRQQHHIPLIATAFALLLPADCYSQQFASSRLKVSDGVTEQQLSDAGFPKNEALAKLLRKHKFRSTPESTWITDLVGSPPTSGRFDDLHWGNVTSWRECKGEGVYHSGSLNKDGGASLTKTLAQLTSDPSKPLYQSQFSREEYTKIVNQVGKPEFAFERRRDGESTTDLSNLQKVDNIYYRLNFDGRPLGVTFMIANQCMNMRASWEATIGARKQVSDKVKSALE